MPKKVINYFIVFVLLFSLYSFNVIALSLCGDGLINSPGEQCDTNNLGGKTCTNFNNFVGGTLKCSNDCTLDTTNCVESPVCGNGIKESGEDCDGKDFGGISCTVLGGVGGTLTCTSSCKVDASTCIKGSPPKPPFNLRVSTSKDSSSRIIAKLYWENVDGDLFYIYKNKNDGSFELFKKDLKNKFYEDTSGLSRDIKYTYFVKAINKYGASGPSNYVYVKTSSPYCGDSVINTEKEEECDGKNFGGLSCTVLGGVGGTLTCTSSCKVDASKCILAQKCGNGICEKGEADYCPPCTAPTGVACTPCYKGTCPKDCKKITRDDVIDYINRGGVNTKITKEDAIAYVKTNCYGTYDSYKKSSNKLGSAITIAPIILE